ncbi:DUF501 domain-containing protein [Frankia nepalensis]|uniref:DUF501 domain-containing protein n=1 Tax=Frankia nepalensis TaxID=1836974 RepID=A0A937RFD0_9ACTN|nr:DUF501 domain-containing protein [Frankia nepalensis]MBL7498576.1 DUF501 domain-containing protein [Frankia nepalensis]MBL7629167.1 DUF501 domain-containing protein [Frankia nepalensis]
MVSCDADASGELAADLAVVERQLRRRPRAVLRVAHRCSCGLPDVLETAPRLEDGTPFPTLYYLTCPRANAAVSRLEASGLMREMTARLAEDSELAAAYRAAHADYLARRDALGALPGNPGAGGMPERVKCLHVLVAHSLAVGPGVNPFGDEALAAIGEWGARGPCVAVSAPDAPTPDAPTSDDPAPDDAAPGEPAGGDERLGGP